MAVSRFCRLTVTYCGKLASISCELATMVEAITQNNALVIICRPNKSLSWRQAKWFLLLITVWSFCISIGFLLAGAWPILPFFGLEILCLAAASYYVQWTLSHREVITITADEVVLEYGMRWPKFRYAWLRRQIRFVVTEANFNGRLEIAAMPKDSSRGVCIGKNLAEVDLRKLIQLLKAAQLSVRTFEAARHTL